MSATPALTKKQQKALKHHASASGAPKASTSAAAEASAPSAGAGDDDAAVADPLSLLPRGKKTKNKRKIARAEKEGEDVIGDEEEETMGEEQEERRVVKKRKVAEGGAAATEGGKATKVEGAKDGEDKKVAEKPKPKQKQRFILFVGNLPFTSTGPEVAAFFEEHLKYKPQIRLLTSKPDPNAKGKAREGGKSRGIAFAEFNSATPLQACLLLHHIPFPTPDSPRLLNIELSAGGGGQGVARKAKIATKNSSMRQQAGMEGILTQEQVAAKGDEGWGGKGKEKREEAAKSATRRGGGGEGGRGGKGGERGRGGGRGGAGRGGARGGGIDLAGSSRGRSKWAAGTGANGMMLG